jgi:hypothetical protein
VLGDHRSWLKEGGGIMRYAKAIGKPIGRVEGPAKEGPGPYGAKAVGEAGIGIVAPAIANAIYNATGVRIRDLPITPEKILKGLRALEDATRS